MPRSKNTTVTVAAEPSGPRDVPADYFDDEWTEIFPEHALITDTAKALLVTAERLGYDPARAVHAIDAGFRVPHLVADTVEYPDAPSSDGTRTVHTPLAALDKGALPESDPPQATDAPT